MNLRALPLLILLIFCPFITRAQLSGSYTVGGTNPDFAVLQDAIDSLENVGMAGPVTVNIRSGTYVGQIFVDSIPGNSSLNTLTVQSEMLDSSQVVLSYFATATPPTFTVMQINNTANITFRCLTFRQTNMSPAMNSLRVIRILGDVSFTFDHCRIQGPPDWACYSIEYFPDNVVPNKIHLQHSRLDGGTVALIASFQSPDSAWIDSCEFHCDFWLSLEYSVMTHSFGDKAISIGDYAIATEVHFYDNISIGETGIYSRIADVHDNQFHRASFGEWGGIYDVRNNVIDSTTTVTNCANLHDNICRGDINFPPQVDSITLIRDSVGGNIYGTCGNRTILRSNIVRGQVAMDCDTNCEFTDNHFFDDVNLTRPGYRMQFMRNQCDSSLTALYGKYAHYSSNTINGLMDITYCDSAEIVHNNYGPNGSLRYSTSCQWPPLVMYNNFMQNDLEITWQVPGSNPLHNYNNYYPVTYWVDNVSWHIDPQYDANMRATNPLLSALCGYYPGMQYDIDSTVRPWNSAIGANEICLGGGHQQMVTLNCTDSVTLSLCLATNAALNFSWLPATGLSNSSSGSPSARPDSTTLYICTITDTNSLVIEVDSFLVTINYLPTALAIYEWNYSDPSHFQNYSSCADTYLWYFGDGDTSTATNPTHQYDTTGIYNVMLIACNSYGCDTFYLSVSVYVATGITVDSDHSDLLVYPNPANHVLNIVCKSAAGTDKVRASFYDVSGRFIFERQVIDGQVDVSDLSVGSYTCKVAVGECTSTIKVIISR